MAKAYTSKKSVKSVKSASTATARGAMSDLRLRFNHALARVYGDGARESGVEECRRLMSEHSDSREHLRIFISLLIDKTLVVGTSS
jgi:hypothetical protein